MIYEMLVGSVPFDYDYDDYEEEEEEERGGEEQEEIDHDVKLLYRVIHSKVDYPVDMSLDVLFTL
jgi:hypothetical protein